MSDAEQFPTDTTTPDDDAVRDDADALTGTDAAGTQRELDEQRDK